MKIYKILLFTFFIISIFLIVSCNSNTSTLPDSTGKSGELIVVLEKQKWESNLGKSIQNCFGKMQDGLPQNEPMFKVVNISNAAFTGILQRHRNILLFEISNSDNKKSSLEIKKNVWANEQLVIKIIAANDSACANIINKNSETLLNYFNEAELERLKFSIQKNEEKSISKKLEKKHQLTLNVPKGYVVAMDTNNFVWLKNEMEKAIGNNFHQISRGIFIHYQNYTDQKIFQKENLIQFQDSLTQQYIQGAAKNSYLKIESEYPPKIQEINFNSNYAVELRGLWKMQNDFMGGPLLTYCIYDKNKNRVVIISAYLYCPNFDKREYLRELEGIMKSLKI